MALPGPIRNFLYAYESLTTFARRTPWGLVVADPRFPDVYDANKAVVLEPAPGLRMADILVDLEPLLDEARIGFEHLEFMDLTDPVPAEREAEAACGFSQPDAVMAMEGHAARSGRGVEVREEDEPDGAFWRAYLQSRGEFGIEMPGDVYRQLLERDRTVFVPAGMRIFAGYVDAALAGFTSLLSLDGVGYLDNVVTLPAFRRRGVATAAISAALDASVDAGDSVAFLLTELDGMPQRLYERLGMREIARANGYTRSRPSGNGYL